MQNDRNDADGSGPPLTAIMPGAGGRESVPLPYGPDQPGVRIGPYRLLRPLGYGGMGSVWLAVRDDGSFEREVALKLLNPSLSDSDLHARFLQERQIHAGLQHPNIAAMYDGGVEADGRPYFAMEYVDGRCITQFCDEERLSVRERVRLYLQVLDAVAYAHQRLVVHRDLKPGNVLVADGRVVKLLDFGIAKLLESPQRAVMTRFGDRAMTPRYAAPEQIRGERVTVATDVYALGVTLFEILTGRTPYLLDTRENVTIEQAILTRDPQRPTVVLAETGVAAELEPARRVYESGIDVGKLGRELHGDLERILLKAMRKDSAERYPSVEAFSADLSNYLEGRPITARAPSLRYRFDKWIRRHALAVTTGVAVLALLVAGLFVLEAQRQRATNAAARAEATQAFLIGLFEEAAPERGGSANATVRDVLARGAARVDSDLAEDPDLRRRLGALIGRLMNDVGDYAHAEPVLRTALVGFDAHRDPLSDVLSMRLQLAQSLQHQGRHDEAEIEWLAVLEQAPADGEIRADAHTGLGGLYALTNRFEQAIAEHAAAISIWRGQDGAKRLRLATALTASSFALDYADRLDEAEAQLREAAEILRNEADVSPAMLGRTLYQLGYVERSLGRYDAARQDLAEAVALLGESLGADHEVTLKARRMHADVIDDQGDAEASRVELVQILEDAVRRYGADARVSAEIANSLAVIELRDGRYAEAEASFRIVVEVLENEFGEQHLETAVARTNLSVALFEQGRFNASEHELRQALHSIVAIAGEDSSDHGVTLFLLARLQRYQGDVVGAESSLVRSAQVLQAVYGTTHESPLRSRLARVVLALDRDDDPAQVLEVLAQIEPHLHDESRRARHMRVDLLAARARALAAQGALAQARRVLSDAVAKATEEWPKGSRVRAEVLLELAEVLRRQGDVAGARARAREAAAANVHGQVLSPHAEGLRVALARLQGGAGGS